MKMKEDMIRFSMILCVSLFRLIFVTREHFVVRIANLILFVSSSTPNTDEVSWTLKGVKEGVFKMVFLRTTPVGRSRPSAVRSCFPLCKRVRDLDLI